MIENIRFKIIDIKKKISNLRIISECGGGLIKIFINADRKITEIKIDNDVIGLNDREILQDLITISLNISLKEVDFKINKELGNCSNFLFSDFFSFFF